MSQVYFANRSAAGKRLARQLQPYAGRDALVLALPRGGVPVAALVAKQLAAELDLLIVRKLGLPGNPEVAMGAIASGGITVLHTEVIHHHEVTDTAIEQVRSREMTELKRRELNYRGDLPPPQVAGRTVIVVDDGLATGATMEAALRAVRNYQPERLIAALPVAAAAALQALEPFADDIVCVATPEPFCAVSLWYGDFRQTTDDEVRSLLHSAASQ